MCGVFYWLEGDGGEAVLGFAQDLAFLLPDPVGEEDAVEVINFVLNVGGLDVGEIFLDFFEGRCLKLQSDRVVAVDEAPDSGDGETAFEPAVLFLFVDGRKHLLAGRSDDGVDINGGVILFLVEEDEEAFVQADLSGG